ncbi:MAG: zinc-binding dehydrogenase [Spirochaetota bacterium]
MKVALYNSSIGVPEIVEMPIPDIGEDEILLKPISVGVCGSEILSYRLSGPGSFGHEPAGYVVKIGKRVKNVKEGDRVFVHHRVPCFVCHYCRRGHYSMCPQYLELGFDPSAYAEYTRVKAKNVELDTIKLPDHISFDEGCLIEILSCVWRALKRANIYTGDTILIIGAGFVGLAAVQIARILGAGKVLISDYIDYKLKIAKELGADEVINIGEESVMEKLLVCNKGRKADKVMTIAGSIKAVQDGTMMLDKGGTLIQFGPTEQNAAFSWSPNDFFYREISYISSYSSSPLDTKEVAHHLFRGDIKVKKLITHHFPLDKIREALELKRKAVDSLKIIIHPHPGQV